MKVKSESEVVQSCPTPSDPMDCSPPDSSVHGIFQARVLERVAIAAKPKQKPQLEQVEMLPLVATLVSATEKPLLLDAYPPATWEARVRSLGWEDPLKKGTATHSSILAWRIPWTV